MRDSWHAADGGRRALRGHRPGKLWPRDDPTGSYKPATSRRGRRDREGAENEAAQAAPVACRPHDYALHIRHSCATGGTNLKSLSPQLVPCSARARPHTAPASLLLILQDGLLEPYASGRGSLQLRARSIELQATRAQRQKEGLERRLSIGTSRLHGRQKRSALRRLLRHAKQARCREMGIGCKGGALVSHLPYLHPSRPSTPCATCDRSRGPSAWRRSP